MKISGRSPGFGPVISVPNILAVMFRVESRPDPGATGGGGVCAPRAGRQLAVRGEAGTVPVMPAADFLAPGSDPPDVFRPPGEIDEFAGIGDQVEKLFGGRMTSGTWVAPSCRKLLATSRWSPRNSPCSEV